MTTNSKDITILFLGDYSVKDPQKYRIGDALKNEIAKADIVGVNFEGCVNGANIISPTGKSVPQSMHSGSWCLENGINLFSLANNHIMDFGEEGLEKTISSLGKNSSIIGVGTYDSAFRPKIYEIKGKKIGFIAGTSSDFSSFKSEWDDKNKIGCPWFRSEKFTLAIIKTIKECDYLFVVAHGGVEHFELPIPEIRDLYRFWIDLGVSGVIASHPHVPQGVECYRNSPIFYSLGNFIFEGTKKTNALPCNWLNSLAAIITINEERVIFSYLPLTLSLKEDTVDISRSSEYSQYLTKLCILLRDNALYMEMIKEGVGIHADRFNQYLLTAMNAVLIQRKMSCLKSILRALIKGKRNDKSFLHQLREDSTVNTIIRDLKYKSKSYL